MTSALTSVLARCQFVWLDGFQRDVRLRRPAALLQHFRLEWFTSGPISAAAEHSALRIGQRLAEHARRSAVPRTRCVLAFNCDCRFLLLAARLRLHLLFQHTLLLNLLRFASAFAYAFRWLGKSL